MSTIQGLFTFEGAPVKGVTCNLWPSTAAFGTYPPQMDTAEPSGSATATATTGESSGCDGAYLFTSVTPGEWWVSQTYGGHIAWDYFNIPHHSGTIVLCQGFTPTGTGADISEVLVPYDPADGTTSLTFNVRRIWFRVNVAGGAPVAVVQKSTVGNATFGAGTTVGTLTMPSGGYEVAVTSALGTVASGNKLRFSVTTLGTATGWAIGVEIST